MAYRANSHPPQRRHSNLSHPVRAARSVGPTAPSVITTAIVRSWQASTAADAIRGLRSSCRERANFASTSARAEICRTTRDCFDIATGPGRFPCSQLCTPEALAQAASWVADISDGAADHRTALMIKGNSRLHQRRARLSAARRDRWPALSNRSGATLSAISSLAARDLGNAISSAPASICNAIACASGSSGSSSITPPSEAA